MLNHFAFIRLVEKNLMQYFFITAIIMVVGIGQRLVSRGWLGPGGRQQAAPERTADCRHAWLWRAGQMVASRLAD